ncbi:hypothetical protein Tco_1344004 [Tanacetum coccineum]
MGDENPICTLGDYSKPSHEGYRNTIELPVGNNVVPLRSDTVWLVQNGCSFHGLWSEDPNQHLKDFLKLVDLLDLDSENRTYSKSPSSWHRLLAPRISLSRSRQSLCLKMSRVHPTAVIELENQVQRLMEAHLALTQPTQVNKITTSCEICSGPHDTQCCMEDPEQAFIEYKLSPVD